MLTLASAVETALRKLSRAENYGVPPRAPKSMAGSLTVSLISSTSKVLEDTCLHTSLGRYLQYATYLTYSTYHISTSSHLPQNSLFCYFASAERGISGGGRFCVGRGGQWKDAVDLLGGVGSNYMVWTGGVQCISGRRWD